ncbi:hypothetical protein Ae168Ps1_2974 [Pseudonocardia sp. Ae168_Ps1]|nr:hypothetical protein Ae150APs1_2967 [Pseudonocardia sp. Ae150A_Ps1]OLL80568.1 hypothetical protein Ae168Ps1_2974 [Pseudonocardia sp. Ae168_Ps1]OLL85302.1 hypothetical protein Ae263Ps1_2357c [Pseudonocardia sp. Ae263_Ps1]OLL94671.1 hypothetical protein Ae356Ps1_4568 [Pseudonocardia sp. Ae356_Ps1]
MVTLGVGGRLVPGRRRGRPRLGLLGSDHVERD